MTASDHADALVKTQSRVAAEIDGRGDGVGEGSRSEHNARQAALFDELAASVFASPDATPPEAVPRLRRVAAAVARHVEPPPAAPATGDGDDKATTPPPLSPLRVLDVGTGVGCLVPYYERAARDAGRALKVVGVDLSAEMLAEASRRHPDAEFWRGDIVDFARDDVDGDADAGVFAGPFDAVVFNAVFGNIFDQRAALARAAALTREGGAVVVSHPLGRRFVEKLRADPGGHVPHALPATPRALAALALHAPLELAAAPAASQDGAEDGAEGALPPGSPWFVDEADGGDGLYLAVLRRTPHAPLAHMLYVAGDVAQGYGRGGKKLGVPTANLPESLFASALAPVPPGVYCGWARVGGDDDEGGDGGGVSYRAVANVGYSPTFAGAENAEKIVEAHLLEYPAAERGDFYGRRLRLLLCAAQRGEKKFGSFPELVAAIQKDVRDAGATLERSAPLARLAEHAALTGAEGAGAPPRSEWIPFPDVPDDEEPTVWD